MTHVGVPPELRGAGIAGRLTQTALEYAGLHALRVVPMCSYVAAYIRKHAQYQALVKG
jgi:predicted GNAT family acetyltransferase